MPIVNIHMLEGKTATQKEAMYEAVTDALCRTLSCSPEQVRIMITDMANTDFAIAGVSVAVRKSGSS